MSDTEDDNQQLFCLDEDIKDEKPLSLRSSFASLPLDPTDRQLEIANYASESNVLKKKVDLECFKMVKVIGRGAYGKVYLVQEKETRTHYAMKVLKKASIVLHGKDAEHTMNERSILEAVTHPFIVKLHFAFQTPSKLFLILSYASGGELFSYLARERMFSESTASFYIGEILDLKPENVLLSNLGHVVLTDFGLSKVAIGANTVCGTIEFMAPEILAERIPYGKGVDHWSLGIMLYDMLVGKPPFSGGNRKRIMENILSKKPTFPKYITQTAKDLISKLLHKQPQSRLGYGEDGSKNIQKHAFFRKINWQDLLDLKVQPPYIPELVADDDTRHFAKEFTGMPMESPPLEQIGDLSLMNDPFNGFSFVAEHLQNGDV